MWTTTVLCTLYVPSLTCKTRRQEVKPIIMLQPLVQGDIIEGIPYFCDQTLQLLFVL